MIKSLAIIVSVLCLSKAFGGFYPTALFLLIGIWFLYNNFSLMSEVLKLFWPFFILIIPYFLSCFWAHYDPLLALRGVVQLSVSLIFLSLMVMSTDNKKLLSSIAIALGAIIVLGFIFGTQKYYYETKEFLNLGLFNSKNNASLVATYAVFFLLYAFYIYKHKTIIAGSYFVVFCFSMFFMYQAKSLGSLIAAIVCLVVGLIVILIQKMPNHAQRLAKQITSSFIVFSIALVGIALVVTDFSYRDYINFMNDIGKDYTITGRTIIWEQAIHSIQDNIILGVGLQNYWVEGNVRAEYIWDYFNKGKGFGYHNSFLPPIVETGLFGMLFMLPFWLFLFTTFYKTIFKADNPEKVLATVLTVFFLLKSGFEDLSIKQFSLVCLFHLIVWKIYFYKEENSDEGKKIKVA